MTREVCEYLTTMRDTLAMDLTGERKGELRVAAWRPVLDTRKSREENLRENRSDNRK